MPWRALLSTDAKQRRGSSQGAARLPPMRVLRVPISPQLPEGARGDLHGRRKEGACRRFSCYFSYCICTLVRGTFSECVAIVFGFAVPLNVYVAVF
jgi:hypothetical protein